MHIQIKKVGAFVTSLLIAGCSQSPTSPSAAPAAAVKSGKEGSVQGLAAGDVKNGPIEMDLVRVGQGGGGSAAFYANANGEYVVTRRVDTEIYVQIFTSNPAVTNPRLIIDWGNGERDITGCGGCRLTKSYNNEGKYRVTVTMDDRAGGTTSRTFTLNVVIPAVERSGFGTFSGVLATTDPTFNRYDNEFVPPSGFPGCATGGGSYYYDSYRIFHPGGTLRAETILGTLGDSYIHLYAGTPNYANSCQGIVAANDDNSGFESLIEGNFPAGFYTVVVTSFGTSDTGSYTLRIQ